MSITGEADGPPVRSGVSFIDLATGSLCAFGIVNAILRRQQTGRGQRVDGALLDTAIAMLNYQAESYLMVGNVDKAKEQLATLDKLCFFPCDEFSELKKSIADHESSSS